jgi:hypothetical protein
LRIGLPRKRSGPEAIVRGEEDKMGTRISLKNWLLPVISYSMLVWTIICFIGTWIVILRYGILFKGFISIVVTLFFGALIWVVPFVGFLISDLFLSPPGEPPAVKFKDLIRKGLKETKEVK